MAWVSHRWNGSSGVHPINHASGLSVLKLYLDPSLVVPPCYGILLVNVRKGINNT